MLLGNPGIVDLLGTFTQEDLANFTNSIMNNSELSSPVRLSFSIVHRLYFYTSVGQSL